LLVGEPEGEQGRGGDLFPSRKTNKKKTKRWGQKHQDPVKTASTCAKIPRCQPGPEGEKNKGWGGGEKETKRRSAQVYSPNLRGLVFSLKQGRTKTYVGQSKRRTVDDLGLQMYTEKEFQQEGLAQHGFFKEFRTATGKLHRNLRSDLWEEKTRLL